MTDGESIRTAGAPAPVGAYPHARRAGPLLFLSGIGPRSPDGPDILGVTLDADGKILAYDIEAQCHAVFRNVKAVLESAGAVWDDLVDVTGAAFCARRYRLVEAAAGAVAQAVLERFPQVRSVRVTVHKPHAPIAATFDDVGVSILRTRQESGHG
jgi:enamine deaminase RidA (YjgF/YER057c/UK114 family)